MEPIDKICEELASGDQARVYRANRKLTVATAAAGKPGEEKSRAGLAAALAKELEATVGDEKNRRPKYDARVRGQIAQHLSVVAGEPEIPTLVKALGDLDCREMARWALDRLAGPAATKALIDAAVGAIGPEFRVGAINALGRRATPDLVETLKKCAVDSNQSVCLAACDALAKVADEANDAVLVAVAKKNGGGRLAVSKARIRLAESLVKAGKAREGKTVYEAVLAARPAKAQEKAAQMALQKLS